MKERILEDKTGQVYKEVDIGNGMILLQNKYTDQKYHKETIDNAIKNGLLKPIPE